jgi:hypothetical protein
MGDGTKVRKIGSFFYRLIVVANQAAVSFVIAGNFT